MLSSDATGAGVSMVALPSLHEQLQLGVELLGKGGVVAFPTDTLFGLGADFTSVSAVQRVLSIKERDAQMGLPLLLAEVGQLSLVARLVPDAVWLLAERFWPGALTLVVPRSSMVSDLVTGGRDSVAVRVPDHPVPRALARGLGRPITGTSVNRSGQPAALTAEEALGQFGTSVDLVINGGSAPQGLQSTILDATGQALRVIRPGAVSLDAIRSAYLGNVDDLTGPG